MLINPMAVIQPLTLHNHTQDVSIFRNTRAIDIPDKLNSIANNVKSYINTDITTPVLSYMNSNISTMHAYINDVAEQVVADQTTFTTNMTSNLSGYVDNSGVGYSAAQARTLVQTGETGTITYDGSNRITGATQGAITTSLITYDDSGNITSFTESITVDSITTSTNYSVSYGDDGIPSISIV